MKGGEGVSTEMIRGLLKQKLFLEKINNYKKEYVFQEDLDLLYAQDAETKLFSWLHRNIPFRSEFTSALEIFRFPEGRGMRAKAAIHPGEPIAIIPKSLLITPQSLIDHSPEPTKLLQLHDHLKELLEIPENEIPDQENNSDRGAEKYQKNLVLLAALILVDAGELKNSFFSSYYKVVPKRLDQPWYWDEHDFDELQGTMLQYVLHQKKMLLYTFNEYVVPVLRGFGLMEDEVEFESFQWIVSLLWSRSFCVRPSMEVLLVPWVDMINQSLDKEHLSISDFTYDGEHFVLTSNVEYSVGSEVFISYGDKSNPSFLQSHGILLENNPNQHFEVLLWIPSYQFEPDPFLYRIKQDYFKTIQADSSSIILYADLIPYKLVATMRIYALTFNDLNSEAKKQRVRTCLQQNEPISDENERTAVMFILQACEHTLGLYETDLEYDKHLLEGKAGRIMSSNAFKAIYLRVAEKRVLWALKYHFVNILQQIEK
eukprot:TRINITY_DN18074_c0_g1_i1.p1 TRINITY_DN18074_c0_g1~~TRINITY_DN18074_c0_g1_i1.p1  ORF type:complete len:485 (-),score=100.35 TRINITY_DN18074_c0_g1_i1:85-1539(-)